MMDRVGAVDYVRDRAAAADQAARRLVNVRAAHDRCGRHGVLRRCAEPSAAHCC